MDQFEDDLKQALKRVDPPAGFEQRVLARLSRRTPPRQLRRFTVWAVAAGFALASFGGVALYRYQQQQRRAVEASDQLLLALRVTGQKLDAVRNRINHTTESEPR